MTGEATTHYLWFDHKTADPTWDKYKASLQLQFGDSTFIDYDEDLKNLTQTTTVPAYQRQFERLASMVQWPKKALIRSFKGGLRSDIKREMMFHRFERLQECFAIARLYEERIEERKEGSKESSSSSESESSSSSSSDSSSEEEIQVRRRGKKIEPKEQKDKRKEETLAKEEKPEEVESLHSIQDPHKANAMRVFGRINGQKALILLDSGATNNFLTEEAAERSKVILKSSTPQTIIVGGGYRLKCLHEGKGMDALEPVSPSHDYSLWGARFESDLAPLSGFLAHGLGSRLLSGAERMATACRRGRGQEATAVPRGANAGKRQRLPAYLRKWLGHGCRKKADGEEDGRGQGESLEVGSSQLGFDLARGLRVWPWLVEPREGRRILATWQDLRTRQSTLEETLAIRRRGITFLKLRRMDPRRDSESGDVEPSGSRGDLSRREMETRVKDEGLRRDAVKGKGEVAKELERKEG
ncbi:hypothetical protein EJ110_NYTH51190 [Nymphaea thermarum]|nr:hypothetical protein EJ110_NYTH51190 [Nymphaea thermarum]